MSLVQRIVLIGALLATSSASRLIAAEDHPVPSTVSSGAKLVEVYGDDRFFEGPTWDPETGKLLFTAFRGKDTQILRLDEGGKAHVWADDTKGVNGTYLSKQGRLLGAMAFGNKLVSYGIGLDGPTDTKVLIDDTTLNQPNDVAESPRKDGGIYYTDPDFQNHVTSAVFHLSTKGKVTRVLNDMPLPNGCLVSVDGKTLYVGDSHLKHWRAYPIQKDGTLGPGIVFFDPDTENRNAPDGMSSDIQGNLYLSGRGGVWVCDKWGNSLGLIAIPEFCSNLTFGGADGKTLYLTCSKKVYSLKMNVRGAQFPAK
jgi:gluconolactonase